MKKVSTLSEDRFCEFYCCKSKVNILKSFGLGSKNINYKSDYIIKFKAKVGKEWPQILNILGMINKCKKSKENG